MDKGNGDSVVKLCTAYLKAANPGNILAVHLSAMAQSAGDARYAVQTLVLSDLSRMRAELDDALGSNLAARCRDVLGRIDDAAWGLMDALDGRSRDELIAGSRLLRGPWVEPMEQGIHAIERAMWLIHNPTYKGNHPGGADDGDTTKATRRERRVKWLAEAMLTVQDHPEWPDAEIARRVGIDKSRLSRTPEYRMAATMARAPKTPAGSVSVVAGVRKLEAVDDSFDPNRRASHQWQDEEDIDDRIDRDMNETQRNTQRGRSNRP